MGRLPERDSRHLDARRARPWRHAVAGLGALLIPLTGPFCGSGLQVRNRPPDPVLVDAEGAADPSGFDALVAEIEAERHLTFVQRPTLELAGTDDPRMASLRAAARALEPCSGSALEPGPAAGSCFPDPSAEWIVCVAPPDIDAARRALRRVLDAQRYPRLAHVAGILQGDPGVALRALLAASANGAGGAPPGADPNARDLLDLAEIPPDFDPAPQGCVALAEHFLYMQEDREAPFRRPPSSTKQLLSPKRYRAGERPTLLVGDPPQAEGCSVASDESVGLARLLIERLPRDGSLSGPALASWQGDRAVRFACESGAARWIYVAELSDPARADAFANALPSMLGTAFSGTPEVQTLGRRVVAWSGIAPPAARAWAVSLASEPLIGLPGAE